MKKLFAVLLALTLVLSMGTIALATDGSTTVTTGTITISNAVEDATYNIYKMFDFAPVAGNTTQGRYTVVTGWEDFLTGAGAAYLAANGETGTIEWVGEETDARKAELAKAAVAYAKENGIAATATQTATADGTVTFSNVDLGYYAIDTSLGTVCGLTNVDNTFEAHEKNEKPEIDKEVQEDADDSWGKVNDADIDQAVNYKATITVATGAVNYVMHDTMSEGLTFNNDVKVYVGDAEVTTGFTVNAAPTDGCTFEVAFDNDYIATLAAGTEIEVTYSATLNENAVIATTGNSNKVVLKYGDNNEFSTTEKETKTYTWKMDVLKYTKGDADAKLPLAGAKFQLLKADGTVIKFTDVTAEGGVPTYKVDAEGTVTEITTDEDGKFEIIGLDEGSYLLRETEAPAGYNKLAGDISVVITSTHDDATLTASYEINDATPATIEVENKTGSLLPETGGIGTTIFYVVGGILMLAAFVLLVSKKRMASFA